MRGNDLGNKVIPRDVVVWEGLLGLVPTEPKSLKQYQRSLTKKRWKDAVDAYEINEMMARKINDLVWRFDVRVDLLTYLGHAFAAELEKRIEREQIPVGLVWYEDPYVLARRLAVIPSIRTIYDPDPQHQFVYGSKGRVLLPEEFNLLGGL